MARILNAATAPAAAHVGMDRLVFRAGKVSRLTATARLHDPGAPVGLVVLIAVPGVVGGIQAMNRVKARLVGP
jgi:hypothetical protein